MHGAVRVLGETLVMRDHANRGTALVQFAIREAVAGRTLDEVLSAKAAGASWNTTPSLFAPPSVVTP